MAAVYQRVSKVSCSQSELNHSGSSPPWRRSSPGKNGTTETARRGAAQCHPPLSPATTGVCGHPTGETPAVPAPSWHHGEGGGWLS